MDQLRVSENGLGICLWERGFIRERVITLTSTEVAVTIHNGWAIVDYLVAVSVFTVKRTRNLGLPLGAPDFEYISMSGTILIPLEDLLLLVSLLLAEQERDRDNDGPIREEPDYLGPYGPLTIQDFEFLD